MVPRLGLLAVRERQAAEARDFIKQARGSRDKANQIAARKKR